MVQKGTLSCLLNENKQHIKPMKDELYKKYLDNTLTPEELARFREQLKATSDDDMADLIDAHWLAREKATDGSSCSSKETEVKHRIDAVLAGVDGMPMAEAPDAVECDSRPRPVIRLLRRVLRYAAVLLLPLLAFTTYYYYTAATAVPTGMMTVSAPSASTAEALLPDGTHVTLSHDSRLSYNLSDFNGKLRRVSFSGEGWFDVAHDASSPFQVSLEGLTIHVLGTRFNVSARSCSRTSAVALLEGRVELTTADNGRVLLLPGQEAVYDKATGHISVNSHADIAATQAWRHHEMKFTHADISTVADRLAAEYGVAITMVGNTSAHFTGVLPTDDLDACLRILKATYGLSYHISGKTVTLRMKKEK